MKKIISILLIISMSISQVTFAIGTIKITDINNCWAKAEIEKLIALNIVNGAGGKFNPINNVSRAEYVKMLVQAMGYTKVDAISFADIKPEGVTKANWASVYIETALRNGVYTKEEIGNNFYPDKAINRIDMFIMLAKALKLEPSTGVNPFADLTKPNGYLTKLYEERLVTGTIVDGKRYINADKLTTKAEAAAIISRLVDYKANPAGYKAKLVAEERKYAVNENGVPVRLFDYPDGLATWLYGVPTYHNFEEMNKLYYDKYGEDSVDRSGYPDVENYPSAEAYVHHQVDIVKQYMKTNWNVDYRTVGQLYINGIGNTLGVGSNYEANKNIVAFKKYKLVCQSQFLTDYNSIYNKNGSDTYVRGTLRIKFEKPTNIEYLKISIKHLDTTLETCKWYDIDMEILLSYDSVHSNWILYDNNYYRIIGCMETKVR